MPNYKVTPEQIDALLPQTQCGECGYPGCMPYAKAIVNKDERLDLCPPGGVATLKKLGELLEKDVTPFIEDVEKEYRPPQLAKIREAECIGCTKCIKACPVDSIIGASKQMHVILENECTGCGLCVPACPVDCIDLFSIDKYFYDKEIAKNRFEKKQIRLEHEKQEKINRYQNIATSDDKQDKKKADILAAVLRVKEKKKI